MNRMYVGLRDDEAFVVAFHQPPGRTIWERDRLLHRPPHAARSTSGAVATRGHGQAFKSIAVHKNGGGDERRHQRSPPVPRGVCIRFRASPSSEPRTAPACAVLLPLTTMYIDVDTGSSAMRQE